MPAPGPRLALITCLSLLVAAVSATASGGGPLTPAPGPQDPRTVYFRSLETGGPRGAARGAAIVVDAEGFAYVTGTLDGDAFVARLTPKGDSVDFLTVVGGADEDAGTAIALGPRGDIFIAGVTRSEDFPGSRPARRRRGGNLEAFVVRLSADGSRLLGTAILGGSGDDAAAGIAVDSSGTIVVTGTTSSYDFPTTRKALQPSLAGMDDAFVVRLAANGLRRIYSTYLGGSGIDRGAAIVLDSQGNAHVAGSTSSADFPVSDSAQTRFGGAGVAGIGDGFVAKLDAAGSRLTYSTFVGGRDDDEATAIALDAQGQALVAGTTYSDDFPTLTPASQAPPGGSDAFVVRLDAAGRQFLTSLLLGSAGDERVTGFAVGSEGDLFVAGMTSSADWPSAGAAAHAASGPASFVLKLRPRTTRLRDAARIAGNESRGGGAGGIVLARGIATGPDGDIFVTGTTDESGLPAWGLTYPADPAASRPLSEEQAAGFATRIAFGTLAAGCPGTINFNNAAGTSLWTDPNNWDLARLPGTTDDVCIDAAFNVTIPTGSTVVNSLTSQGTLTLGAGASSLSLATASRFKDLTLLGGGLTGAGTIDVDGTLTWRGGSFTGPTSNTGVLNVNGTVVLDTNAFMQVTHRILNLKGTVLHSVGSFSSSSGVTINNSGTYKAISGSATYGGGVVNFINTGVIEKSGTGNFSMSVPFNNSGTIDIQQGKLSFGVAYTQLSGTTKLTGGILASTSALVIRGGTLAGSGSIQCNVLLAGGTLSPGLSPGLVNITGEYNQSATSSLNIEIGGSTPGVEHDQLVMSGSGIVTLDGTLNVALTGGFTPSLGDRFDIMTFASRTGTFPTLNLPPAAGGAGLSVVYGANIVSLVAASQKVANLSLDKQDSPDPVAKGAALTYTLTVSNSGPDDATGVKVTDPLPASTTFTSASGPGWTCANGTGPVICTLPSLPASTSSSVSIQVTPTFGPTGLLNVATVSADQTDPLPGNNTAQQGTQVTLTGADLSISVLDSPDPVRIDSPLTFAITVNNAGPDTATSINMTDTIPAGSSYLGFAGVGWACTPNAGHVTCISSNIVPGGSLQLALTVTSPSTGGDIVNTAVVSSAANDPDPNNSTASTTTTVIPPQADLAMVSTDTPDPVGTFSPLIYSLSLTDGGPDPAHDVVLVNTLPPGASFVSAQGAGWSCQDAVGTVTCTRSVLGAGATTQLALTATAPGASGEFDNVATATSAAADPVTSNNAAVERTTVVATHADLSLAVTDSVDPVYGGEQLVYTLQVSNTGPDTANFLTVVDTLPQGTVFTSASGPGWTCVRAAGTVTCTLPSLPVGSAAPIQIAVKAPVTGGVISNDALVTAATEDPDPPNGRSIKQTVVFIPHADLSISMVDAPDPATELSAVFYTLTVSNLGPDPIKTVTVVDTVPASVPFVDVTAPGWSCTRVLPTVTCVAADLPVGTLPTISIRVPILVGAGTLSNSAIVSAVVIDVDPTNNQAAEQTATVSQGADLAALQSTMPDPVGSGEEFTYVLGVRNDGPLTATGVQLVAVLPPGVEFVSSATTPQDMQTGPSGAVRLTYALSNVPPSASVSVLVTARCLAPDPALTSTATVSAIQFDPSLANNSNITLTNCIGLEGSVRFSLRSITPASTSLGMPAVVTMPGAAIDPTTVSITHVNDQRITSIAGVQDGGKVNFNRQTLLRAIEDQLRACTPLEGVPVKLRVSGKTTAGDYFKATDTIAYVKKSPCADGSEACVTMKPATINVTSFDTSPIKLTFGLCIGRIVQRSILLSKVNGVDTLDIGTTRHPKNPDRVFLARPDLLDRLYRSLGFCPAKQIKQVPLIFKGRTQNLDQFEITVPLTVNCGSGF